MKNKQREIEEIIQFVQNHPESTVSRRIYRETLGEAPARIDSAVLRQVRDKLEIADEFTIEGYNYLIR
ncbi:hypothetical protein [Capillibacterium thermochitinicola]|uniref:Uncharacterized protein n=1 Tax=Capillibacterium thermochitinicola TaxID=2699427 RepID=A0A8J6LLW3_9FIRM|nr:hypothetical protein [Capillibacterium thermochitinicola]MBA2132874.1 hypothetical protein [Capillibacterium thermochitinicola]